MTPEPKAVAMDAEQAGRGIEREMLILTRHRELTSPRQEHADTLDRSAYVLLSRIEAQGPMSVADFIAAFGLTASTFSRQTTALLRDGLVEPTVDPEGGVGRKFRLTQKGIDRLNSHREVIVRGVTEVVEEWPPERLDRFITDLRQFNQDIERLTGREWPR